MIVALIDNGSLEVGAHRNLRTVAAALSARVAVTVEPVSWKHSNRVPAAALDGLPASVLGPWLRAQFARGEREFVLVPFFISAQGAIGSALRGDLERLQRELGDFRFHFTAGLAATGRVDPLAQITADRVRETIAGLGLNAPAVIVVDHGGPSPASAALRDEIAAAVRTELGAEIGPLSPASMEGESHPHNRPLLAQLLATPGFDRGDLVIAPLFLSPGRHAGPNGDLAAIARAAEDRLASSALRCHFTGLVGTHPQALDVLETALRATLSKLHAEIPV